MRRIVEQVGGGRAKRRRLALALAGNPSVLTAGRSPAARVVGDLLIALRAAGAKVISPPRCAGCGRERHLGAAPGRELVLRAVLCRPEDLRGLRPRAAGRRSGTGTAGRAAAGALTRTTSDPVTALVGIITAIDAGLPRRGGRAQRSAGDRHQAGSPAETGLGVCTTSPELLTGDGARRHSRRCCGSSTRSARPGPPDQCAPACPRCGRVITLSKTGDGPADLPQLRAPGPAPCPARAAERSASRPPETPTGRPLCPYCLVTDPVNLEECVRCGRAQPGQHPDARRGRSAPTCSPRDDRMTCAICGRPVPCAISKITGQPWCRACARCAGAQCSRLRAARRRSAAGTRDAPLCADLHRAGSGFWKACPACGGRRAPASPGVPPLPAPPAARRAARRRHGHVRPELRVLHENLAGVERPATVLDWLAAAPPPRCSAELASGQRPLTHAALDELPPSKTIEHLRAVLVATGSAARP